MTKQFRKEIMKRSKLKNKYNKKINYENWTLYKKTKKLLLNTVEENQKSLLRKTEH